MTYALHVIGLTLSATSLALGVYLLAAVWLTRERDKEGRR